MWRVLRFRSLFKACGGCGWKALDLQMFILNKSDSSPHLQKNLYPHLHSGLLDVNVRLCVAFLSAQASEFESFWTGSNTRQLRQAGRSLITVNYLSGREASQSNRALQRALDIRECACGVIPLSGCTGCRLVCRHRRRELVRPVKDTHKKPTEELWG